MDLAKIIGAPETPVLSVRFLNRKLADDVPNVFAFPPQLGHVLLSSTGNIYRVVGMLHGKSPSGRPLCEMQLQQLEAEPVKAKTETEAAQ